MKTSVDDAITYEVKKEIAERYFGFRKLIEEDKLSLTEQIRQHTFILEKRISFDLIRIYILIGNHDLIQDFLALSGIPEELFYDPYLIESPTLRQRVFEKVRFRGLTQKGCYTYALFDCYERLHEHIALYREKFEELLEDEEMITEEIKIFYRQNDLGSIMGFLRSLGDCQMTGHMQGGMETDIAGELEKKLQIPPPTPVEQFLPVISPPAPINTIKRDFKKIIKKAYPLQKMNIHQYLSRHSSFFRRAFG